MYAEFEEQLITLKIENRNKNGKTPDNELDLQLRLRRFEKLVTLPESCSPFRFFVLSRHKI